jgi:hypothetical protein
MTTIALLVLLLALALGGLWGLVEHYGDWLARPENRESWP